MRNLNERRMTAAKRSASLLGFLVLISASNAKAGCSYWEELFGCSNESPALVPGSGKGHYEGRETFSVGVTAMTDNILSCIWHTKGGPMFKLNLVHAGRLS